MKFYRLACFLGALLFTVNGFAADSLPPSEATRNESNLATNPLPTSIILLPEPQKTTWDYLRESFLDALDLAGFPETWETISLD
ncbi:MAG TPA: hypothetical protein VEL47_07380 [Myxococcota bacterium]|nr:hypothetical protein [Myxococcota bacterium]